MERKKELLIRLYIVMLFFVVAASLILWRVAKISIIEGDKWQKKGGLNVKWMPLEADRGNIYSEDGSLLATSLQFFEIRMDMTVPGKKTFQEDIDSLSICLHRMFPAGKNAQQWKKQMLEARKKKNGYFFIAKDLDIDQFNTLKMFPIFRKGQYGGGLIAHRYGKRAKPFKELASRTIGEDRDNAVKVGIEGYFDKFLSGATDQILMKRISSSSDDWIPVFDPSQFEQLKGSDIVTTINIAMQDVLHDELSKSLVTYSAKGGIGIIMDVKTGAIKAISNLSRSENGGIREIYNHAIGTLSEPGSTFKLASTLAMLDDGYADLDTKVNLNGGKRKFHNLTMYDSEMHGIYESNLQTAFEKSSNVGIAYLTNSYYNTKENRKAFISKLEQFGLKDKTGIEVLGEKIPYIKDPDKDKDKWYGTTIPWMAHGYELMITPLQMLNFFNAVANDGKLMKPYIVSKIMTDGNDDKVFKPKVLRSQIASKDAISKAQKLLRGVVERGTAKSLNSDLFTFAGKTGTTRTNYADGDDHKKYNASFAGYFPAENPKYSMIIIVYEPHGKYYGGSVAGPVFKTIGEQCYSIDMELTKAMNEGNPIVMNIDLPEEHAGYKNDFEDVFNYVGLKYKQKSNGNWVDVDPFENRMLIKKRDISDKNVPDVRGMGARDAVYVLENLGLNVDIKGAGKVSTQSIKPGTALRGQEIKIYLN